MVSPTTNPVSFKYSIDNFRYDDFDIIDHYYDNFDIVGYYYYDYGDFAIRKTASELFLHPTHIS